MPRTPRFRASSVAFAASNLHRLYPYRTRSSYEHGRTSDRHRAPLTHPVHPRALACPGLSSPRTPTIRAVRPEMGPGGNSRKPRASAPAGSVASAHARSPVERARMWTVPSHFPNRRCYPFPPLFREAAHPRRQPVGGKWRVDEMYRRLHGRWAYPYRAIDQDARVVDTTSLA